jgi:hypothetical protein
VSRTTPTAARLALGIPAVIALILAALFAVTTFTPNPLRGLHGIETVCGQGRINGVYLYAVTVQNTSGAPVDVRGVSFADTANATAHWWTVLHTINASLAAGAADARHATIPAHATATLLFAITWHDKRLPATLTTLQIRTAAPLGAVTRSLPFTMHIAAPDDPGPHCQ